MEEPHGQNADQHEGRAGHREEEELGGRVGTVVVAPSSDEEVHGHQHHFEAEEENHQVEDAENAHHPGFQQEHPREVRGLVVARVDGHQGNREKESGKDDQE